jgi:undecaprenyl-diphosphatase
MPDGVPQLIDWAGASGLNHSVYAMLNGIAGRSWTLDTLIALPLENALVKAGVIGACFVYAWYRPGTDGKVIRRRKILLVSILASLLAIAITKPMSGTFFFPRPFVQAQGGFYLEDGRLVEAAPIPHRVPLDTASQAQFRALEQGDIAGNDMGSFPSDHASFFITLALGIFLACRRAGAIALAWTLLVTLASRVITGQHWPLDILAGAAIGVAVLALLQLAARRWGNRLTTPPAAWTLRHPAWSAAILFLVIFEATNTLQGIRPVAGLGSDVARGVIGV